MNTWSPATPSVARRVIIPKSEWAEAPHVSSPDEFNSPIIMWQRGNLRVK